VHGSNGGSY